MARVCVGAPGRRIALANQCSPWADAANIQDGVTFDLSLLNQVRLSDDRTVASVGPGARWSEVYDALVPLGAAVVGGRENKVGVGGLTTGGETYRCSRTEEKTSSD